MDQILENYFNLTVMAQAFPDVLRGFLITVQVAACVIVIGVATGLFFALLRATRNRVLSVLVTIYVEVFRTLPQLVIIIFIYFGLPYMGIVFSPFFATSLALAAVLAAFSAEIFWATIMAVPKGQWEAAHALGVSRLVTMRMVILPQAIRLAIPLITNRAIAITKGTALGAAISLPEALGSAQSAMSIHANPSPLTLAAGFYLAFFIPLVWLSRVLEKRFSRSQ
ncbi:amino acid ABC transporter permease [Neorhizobium sp. Rsf11]|uniref:Amino acid ABC transporter permease n=2 Tax=Neorhizobium TaxID=1525371 RepID=A0ABV0MC54_9HYPH|nr:amino acid ABC transporter permease [Neorhizobium petrolearium]MCC2613683.1 amino acid ABC transporter permease [Neorhizobium petrolearium]WGI71998.1 amino acid ABC transporter permease [Neorhizobium petrolearium]